MIAGEGSSGGRGPFPAPIRRNAAPHGEIADIVTTALAEGRPIALAVALHFGINEKAARNRIQQARRAGYQIPYGDRSVRARAADRRTVTPRPGDSTPRVLACTATDCGFEAAVDRVAELLRHTFETHHRPPSKAERTPVLPAGDRS